MQGLEDWITASGPAMYLLAPLFMVVVAIVPFPVEVPAAIDGMVFGPVAGTAVTWSGAMLGAVVSYELGRRFGRPFLRRVVSGPTLDKAERVLDGAGVTGLLLLRLTPLVAFHLLNYGAGLACLPRRRFLWTTGVGILPGTIAFTASGSGLAALYARHPVIVLLLIVLGTLALVINGIRRSRENGSSHGPR